MHSEERGMAGRVILAALLTAGMASVPMVLLRDARAEAAPASPMREVVVRNEALPTPAPLVSAEDSVSAIEVPAPAAAPPADGDAASRTIDDRLRSLVMG